MKPSLSKHAKTRSVERNLSSDDLNFVLSYGERLRRTGVIFCQLRKKDIPQDKQTFQRYGRLVGTTIVLCSCGSSVITLYRNEKAFRKDQSKSKYDSKKASTRCSCSGCDERMIA